MLKDFLGLDYQVNAFTYFDAYNVASISAYFQDLLSVFILMNWIRMLKFLRILPFTGPVVQSIMDTLQSRAVRIFIAIIAYMLVIFGLGFHIAFGPDLLGYNRWPDSILTLVQIVFGQFDYPSLYTSNKVFGPFFFAVFMIFLALILMNLLIGVLGKSYENAQELNIARYNRYITHLMMDSIEERCNPKKQDKHIVSRLYISFFRNTIGFYIPFMRAITQLRLHEVGNMELDEFEDDIEDVKFNTHYKEEKEGRIIEHDDFKLDEQVAEKAKRMREALENPDHDKKEKKAKEMNETERKLLELDSTMKEMMDTNEKRVLNLQLQLSEMMDKQVELLKMMKEKK